MPYPVRPTADCLDEIAAREAWFRRHFSDEHADRWFSAVDEALDSLAAMPESRPLVLDPLVQGRGLREHYFGAGRKNTHRLIFRVAGGAVEVVTVRGFAEDELTPRNL